MTNSIHRPSPTSVISGLLDTAVEVQHATRFILSVKTRPKAVKALWGFFSLLRRLDLTFGRILDFIQKEHLVNLSVENADRKIALITPLQ